MKKLLGLLLLAASLGSTGCARPHELGWTPAYSYHERQEMILRNWDYEGKQKDDDIDTALLVASGESFDDLERSIICNVR